MRIYPSERVNELIERVIKAHPGMGATAQARYYEAVHQELAPLARALEDQRDELLAALKVLRERHQIDDPHHADLCPFCLRADAAIAHAGGRP